MSAYKVYISYVIQQPDQHIHQSAVVDFPLPRYSFYMDNSAEQVLKWAEGRQAELRDNQKIIIVYFFNVPKVK
jgi:hypothetical protein